jgi:hypothetical protein
MRESSKFHILLAINNLDTYRELEVPSQRCRQGSRDGTKTCQTFNQQNIKYAASELPSVL